METEARRVNANETTILVVTPAFNSGKTIERTIFSVISQQGNFKLIYHIQDGGSTDNTIEACKRIKKLVDSKEIPLFCRDLTIEISSEGDAGMYDAIWKGFNSYKLCGDTWMGWINSDDILRPGACALLSEVDSQHGGNWIKWIGGRTSVCDDSTGMQIGHGKRPHNRQAIKRGLCEGLHWDFIQQEGIFFRNSLWQSVDNIGGFRHFKYAGDWNLWRMFAHEAEFFQVPWATGSFFRVQGQISDQTRYLYEAEICQTISAEERLNSLIALKPQEATGYLIGTAYTTKEVFITTTDQSAILQSWQDKNKNRIQIPKSEGDEREKSEDMHHYSQYIDIGDRSNSSLLIHPDYWQYPAITEKHAALKAAYILPEREGYCYFGFPWATLVDMIECGDPRRFNLLNSLGKHKERLSQNLRVFTTCQHVLQYKYEKLLEWAGVTDVFWSHHNRHPKISFKRIRVNPFPLYPLQTALLNAPHGSGQKQSNQDLDRDILCSFVGARYCDGYLSRVRDWIIDNLKGSPRVKIISRSDWHYQNDVYVNQISSGASDPETKSNDDGSYDQKSEEYVNIMRRSRFSLCPSGSGPNSIRLWEALMLRSIPMVLSNYHILPGPKELWSRAIVSLPEEEEVVKNVIDVIEQVKDEDIRDARLAMNQLSLLYGPETFITDVLTAWIDEEVMSTAVTTLIKYKSSCNNKSTDRIKQILSLSVSDHKKREAITKIIKSELRLRPQSKYLMGSFLASELLDLGIVIESDKT